VVSQDTFLFNDTVANNIAFGLDDADEFAVRRAADLAAATDFIERMPNGFATGLGDRGVRLSGGQQQRIAIARAVLGEPDVLILDEATSHLDTVTEHAISQAIDTLRDGRTMIVVAHRLSTIRRADKVVVMVGGRVVEEGRHDDLMAKGGLYRDMVEHQSLGLVDEDGPQGATQ
jgi:ABC-type multidrug transport system fused ATPase/permease subunit